MTWKRHVLVVANVTAASDELCAALTQRAESQPSRFTLIIPATPFGGGRAAAETKLAEALERLQAADLEADGSIGDGDPLIAVTEAWDPKRYDEVVISTLPMRVSKWLHAGLPERVQRLTGAPVTHLVSHPPKPVLTAEPAPAHEDLGVMMGPLSVLRWVGPKPEHQPG